MEEGGPEVASEKLEGRDLADGGGGSGEPCLGPLPNRREDRLERAAARYGFVLEAMPEVEFEGERISSSAVREALLAADFERAERLLGRPYVLSGRVAHGAKLGRKLGFATANLMLPRRARRPGRYVVKAGAGEIARVPRQERPVRRERNAPQAVRAQRVEGLRGDVLPDGEVPLARAQVLAEGEQVHAVRAQVAHRLEDLLARLAEAEQLAREYLDRVACERMIVIPGNHDSRNVGYVHFEELFGDRNSVLNVGRATIVAVDSSEPDLDNGQIGRGRYRLIEEAFASAADLKVFVLHHHLLVQGRDQEMVLVLFPHLAEVGDPEDVDVRVLGFGGGGHGLLARVAFSVQRPCTSRSRLGLSPPGGARIGGAGILTAWFVRRV